MADRIDDTIAEAAAEWFVRLKAEDSCEQDLDGFNKWIAQNPLHGEAYRQIEATWIDVGGCDFSDPAPHPRAVRS